MAEEEAGQRPCLAWAAPDSAAVTKSLGCNKPLGQVSSSERGMFGGEAVNVTGDEEYTSQIWDRSRFLNAVALSVTLGSRHARYNRQS